MDILTCMVAVMFFETRREVLVDMDASRAVGTVVMNRVADPRWPDNVCDVVWQRKQFSWTHDGKSDNVLVYDSPKDKEALGIIQQIAAEVLAGETLEITSNHFHAPYVYPKWRHSMQRDGYIGGHYFYTKD